MHFYFSLFCFFNNCKVLMHLLLPCALEQAVSSVLNSRFFCSSVNVFKGISYVPFLPLRPVMTRDLPTKLTIYILLKRLKGHSKASMHIEILDLRIDVRFYKTFCTVLNITAPSIFGLNHCCILHQLAKWGNIFQLCRKWRVTDAFTVYSWWCIFQFFKTAGWYSQQVHVSKSWMIH